MLSISDITSGIFFNLKIEIKDFNEIIAEPEFLAKLRYLTINQWSGLNYEMNNFIRISERRSVHAQAILAYLSGELVAWALYSEEPSDFCFPNDMNFNPSDGVLFEVYVRPEHRRTGIGGKLLNVAKRLASPKKLCVCPWDNTSTNFYNNFKHLDCKEL